LQFLVYGFDDQQHCVWWKLVEHDCMPGKYIIEPDYSELLRRLPAGAGEPSADNTLAIATQEQQQEAEQRQQQSAAAGNSTEQQQQQQQEEGPPPRLEPPKARGKPLGEVLEAAQGRDAPHILFLDAIPDLTAGSWAEDEAADKAWKEWQGRCAWAAQEPHSQQGRRRRLGERRQGASGGDALRLLAQRHAHSERGDLEAP
jgi:hypothetical protein